MVYLREVQKYCTVLQYFKYLQGPLICSVFWELRAIIGFLLAPHEIGIVILFALITILWKELRIRQFESFTLTAKHMSKYTRRIYAFLSFVLWKKFFLVRKTIFCICRAFVCVPTNVVCVGRNPLLLPCSLNKQKVYEEVSFLFTKCWNWA